MRLLPRPRPDVDIAIVKESALPVEWSVLVGHCLENEIVRLPELVHHADGILVGAGELVRHAFDEAHLQPPARDHVDGGKLLGDAQRIGAMADRISEHQKARAPGLPRQHREADHHGRGHASRRLVVLVEHDVEAELIGEQPLVVEAVIELSGYSGIAFAVRQVHAQRAIVIVPGVRIGLLGEMIDPHDQSAPSRKANTVCANASGCSRCGKWPARSTGAKRAFAMAAQNARP